MQTCLSSSIRLKSLGISAPSPFGLFGGALAYAGPASVELADTMQFRRLIRRRPSKFFAFRLDSRQEQLPKIPATAEATAAEAATAAERSLPEFTLAPLLELTGLVSVVLGPLNPVDLLCTTSRVFSRPPLTSSCCCLRRLTGVTAWSLQSLLELRFLWLWGKNIRQ